MPLSTIVAKLDGISHSKSKKRKPDGMFKNDDDADYYDDDPYDEREEDMRIGKKRVLLNITKLLRFSLLSAS